MQPAMSIVSVARSRSRREGLWGWSGADPLDMPRSDGIRWAEAPPATPQWWLWVLRPPKMLECHCRWIFLGRLKKGARSRVVLWSSVSCVEVLKLYHHGSRWSAAMEEWEHGRSSFHGSSAKPTETTWKRFIPSCQAHACLWPWRCIHWQLGGPTTTRIWRPGTETVHPPWPISIDLAIQMTFTAMAGLAGWCALWRYLGRVEPLVDLLCLVVKLWLSWRRNVEVRLPLCRRLEGRQSTWLGQAVGKSSVTWHTWEAGPIYWCRRDVSRFTTIVIVDPNLFSASSPSLSTTGWFFKMMLTCSQGEKMREDERRWEK